MEMELPALALAGSEPETINIAALAIGIGVSGCTLLGLAVDHAVVRKRLRGKPEDRPRGWVLGMLVSSYALLVPGLFGGLFAYKIACVNGLKTLTTKQENMIQFASELYRSGSAIGCFFVVGFAIVIPLLKLALLVLGGTMRHSSKSKRSVWSKRSILFVQRISKWASPDMFAYILLMYLIRGLNHPPILNGLFKLDIGFTCFSTFCVASTVSSLGVRMAEGSKDEVMQPSWFSQIGNQMMVGLASAMFIIFCVLLCFGTWMPVMSLRLDMDLLFDSGQMDLSLKPIVETLGIQDMAADDVNLWDCMRKLLFWIAPSEDAPHWEANSLIAFIMLAVFVVVLSLGDMMTLLYSAFYMQARNAPPRKALGLAKILRKLSMLDVAITGVVVIIMAGSIYKKMGVVLQMKIGLLYLSIAEVCHYLTYYMVTTSTIAVSSSDLKQSWSSNFSDESLRNDGRDRSLVTNSASDSEDNQCSEDTDYVC